MEEKKRFIIFPPGFYVFFAAVAEKQILK